MVGPVPVGGVYIHTKDGDLIDGIRMAKDAVIEPCRQVAEPCKQVAMVAAPVAVVAVGAVGLGAAGVASAVLASSRDPLLSAIGQFGCLLLSVMIASLVLSVVLVMAFYLYIFASVFYY